MAKDIFEYNEFVGEEAVSVEQILEDIDQDTVDQIASFLAVLKAGDSVLSSAMFQEIEDRYGIAIMGAVKLIERAAAERRRSRLKDELEADITESILRMTV